MKNKILSILRQARKKLGLSKRQFAKYLKISKSAYCNYEAGKRTPPDFVLRRCCEILKIPFYFRRAEDLNTRRILSSDTVLIGTKIDLLRKIKLYSLKLLSYRSRIPYHRCVKIVKNKVIPTRKEVRQLAYALGFSPTVFRRQNFVKLLSKYTPILL